MSSPNLADTVDYKARRNKALESPEPLSSLVRVDVGGSSHAGKVRANNEDHFLISRYGRFFEALRSSLPSDSVPPRSEEVGYGMVVTDGMGGMAAGEEASRIAISSFVNLVLNTPDWILRLDEDILHFEVMRRARERYHQINERLAKEAQDSPDLAGFGTTMTVAYSVGIELFLAHIGDSRAYLLRQGTLKQLTKDHTVVQDMLDQKLIDSEEAATHRLRHVLTKSLGDHGQHCRPDVSKIMLENNDRLLLCSDGLTEMIDDKEIAAVLGKNEPAQVICDQLVERALEAGGRDNVTVVVASYRLP